MTVISRNWPIVKEGCCSPWRSRSTCSMPTGTYTCPVGHFPWPWLKETEPKRGDSVSPRSEAHVLHWESEDWGWQQQRGLEGGQNHPEETSEVHMAISVSLWLTLELQKFGIRQQTHHQRAIFQEAGKWAVTEESEQRWRDTDIWVRRNHDDMVWYVCQYSNLNKSKNSLKHTT